MPIQLLPPNLTGESDIHLMVYTNWAVDYVHRVRAWGSARK